jgi:non-ribosomal peptide synthetase-like protein
MAQFCARVRKRVDLPTVSMKDIYAHTSVRALAAILDTGTEAATGPGGSVALHVGPATAGDRYPADVWAPETVRIAARSRYWLCGALQLATGLGTFLFGSVVLIRGVEWTATAPTFLGRYERGFALMVATFLCFCALPIVAKWILVGKWTPQQFPVWSLAYLRFWLTKSLIRLSPLALFVGSPLYSVYLRSLGAKVGKGVVCFSPTVAMCPDLFSIGEGAVIHRGVVAQCYRAHRGMIQIGPVTIGDRAVVGEKAVLDINTRIADDAQLGHGSSLHFGQVIPAGERWHGSPAEPTTTDYRRVPPMPITNLRRVLFSAYQLLPAMLVGPAGLSLIVWVAKLIPPIPALLTGPATVLATKDPYQLAAVATVALFFSGLLLEMAVAFTVPRLLNLLIKPDTVYPLYGFHHVVHSMISGMTNLAGLLQLFGDSVYVTDFLRGIGYRLTPLQQTGSNFGSQVTHDNPYMCRIGHGTVVADGLAMVNTDYSSTSFRVSQVIIGENNFLGNNIIYPAEGKTGANCLLATKVMIPIDGPVREGVGLLGSPPFEIPRTVERDKNLEVENPEETRRQLARKTLHNTVTIFLRILSRLLLAFLVAALLVAAAGMYRTWGTLAFPAAALVAGPLVLAYLVLVDRAVKRLQVLVPSGCSILDRRFWRHERYWKVIFTAYEAAFNGTPLKGLLWRAMGVKVGKRLFDDGCAFVEKAFVEIGDDCTLNVGSIVQCHSQEDGAFKSDHSVVGNGVTLGVGAFVHYGVRIGDNAVLAPDSFLMKGEEIPAAAWWGGNPAQERDNPALHGHPSKAGSAAPHQAA